MTSILPIIPALFLVLLASYYSKNYAGILASPLHVATSCKYKTAQCNACQKIGHLARVCKTKTKHKVVMRGQSKADTTKGKDEVHQLETIDTEVPSCGSESDHLYAILQLGNKADKFLVSTKINGVDVEMELDSGADRSTVPWTWYQEKLAGVCKLVPTDVTLYQYDKSPLMIKGQCKVTVQVLDQKICATLMVVDVKTRFPYLAEIGWYPLG